MQKYFASTNRTVATLIPDTTPEPAASTAPKEKQ
jgi:hypothetical protein